jgi:hypothetical protein
VLLESKDGKRSRKQKNSWRGRELRKKQGHWRMRGGEVQREEQLLLALRHNNEEVEKEDSVYLVVQGDKEYQTTHKDRIDNQVVELPVIQLLNH